LDAFTDRHRAAQTHVCNLIWSFYASLKTYRLRPNSRRSAAWHARFDRIVLRRTGFITLDRLLKRLHANMAEFLMVLDRPETPLHTDGWENDIRCYVTRRKVSAGTRSNTGRDCRDAFLGLTKTCDTRHRGPGLSGQQTRGCRPRGRSTTRPLRQRAVPILLIADNTPHFSLH
jgi:hypothetical protein